MFIEHRTIKRRSCAIATLKPGMHRYITGLQVVCSSINKDKMSFNRAIGPVLGFYTVCCSLSQVSSAEALWL